MVESILAWIIERGLGDDLLYPVIGAGIAFLSVLAIYLEKKNKIGGKWKSRLERLARFWKERFRMTTSPKSPPPETRESRPIEKEETPEARKAPDIDLDGIM